MPKTKRPPQPTVHEAAILRRLAQPGAFAYLLVTLRPDEDALYCYEDGRQITNANGRALSDTEFKRLTQWLDPIRDEALLAGPPQRWVARRVGPRRDRA